MTRNYFDEIYAHRRTDRSLAPAHRFAGANLRMPHDAISVLDVGSGEGEFLASLGGRYRTVGMDSSFVALRRSGGSRVQGSVHELPFGDESFDLVSCFEVLEHVPEPIFPTALAELERVSRRYVAISVPNREVLEEGMVRCPVCGCVFHASRHVRSFSEEGLSRLFTRFDMVECKPCGPTARYGESTLARALVSAARRRPPALVPCPQCEYLGPPPDPRGLGDGRMPTAATAREIIKHAAQGILFRAWRPFWLLALYVRR